MAGFFLNCSETLNNDGSASYPYSTAAHPCPFSFFDYFCLPT